MNGQLLYCSLENDFDYDVASYCWTIHPPKNKMKLHPKKPFAQFDHYLIAFQEGLVTYQCQSKYETGFSYYKERIMNNIRSLKKAYRYIQSNALQKEVCQIAYVLSRSYQLEKMDFLHHYLLQQNRLLRLKRLTGRQEIQCSPQRIHFTSARYEWKKVRHYQ